MVALSARIANDVCCTNEGQDRHFQGCLRSWVKCPNCRTMVRLEAMLRSDGKLREVCADCAVQGVRTFRTNGWTAYRTSGNLDYFWEIKPIQGEGFAVDVMLDLTPDRKAEQRTFHKAGGVGPALPAPDPMAYVRIAAEFGHETFKAAWHSARAAAQFHAANWRGEPIKRVESAIHAPVAFERSRGATFEQVGQARLAGDERYAWLTINRVIQQGGTVTPVAFCDETLAETAQPDVVPIYGDPGVIVSRKLEAECDLCGQLADSLKNFGYDDQGNAVVGRDIIFSVNACHRCVPEIVIDRRRAEEEEVDYFVERKIAQGELLFAKQEAARQEELIERGELTCEFCEELVIGGDCRCYRDSLTATAYYPLPNPHGYLPSRYGLDGSTNTLTMSPDASVTRFVPHGAAYEPYEAIKEEPLRDSWALRPEGLRRRMHYVWE